MATRPESVNCPVGPVWTATLTDKPIHRSVHAPVTRAPPPNQITQASLKAEIQSVVENCMSNERASLNKVLQTFDRTCSEKINHAIKTIIEGQFLQELKTWNGNSQQQLQELRVNVGNLQESISSLEERGKSMSAFANLDVTLATIQQELDAVRKEQKELGGNVQIIPGVSVGEGANNEQARVFLSQMSERLTRSHDNLCRLLEVERETRSHDLGALNEMLSSRLTEYLNHESHERATQLHDITLRLEAEITERTQKCNESQIFQTEADAASQQLVASLLELQQAHKQLEEKYSKLSQGSNRNDSCSEQRGHFEALLNLHKETWESGHQSLTESLSDQINNVKGAVQCLAGSAAANQDRFESRHKELGANFDTKQRELANLLEEYNHAWEAKFHMLEPRVDGAVFRLDSIEAAVAGTVESVRHQLKEAEGNLKRSFLTSQQQLTTDTQMANQQMLKTLKEETTQRCSEVQYLKTFFEQRLSQISANYISKEECSKEYASLHSFESVHTELMNLMAGCQEKASQHTNNLHAEIQLLFEKQFIQINEQVENLKSDLVECQQERNDCAERAQQESELAMKQDILAQEIKELKAQFTDELSNTQLQLNSLKRQARKENSTRHEELVKRLDIESAQHNESLERQNTQFRELASAHEQFMGRHKALEEAHAELGITLKGFDMAYRERCNQFEGSLSNHRELFENKLSFELADVRSVLQHLEGSGKSSQEYWGKKLAELQTCFDTECKKTNELVCENRSLWEARLSVLEPRVDTNAFRVDSFHKEMEAGLCTFRHQLEEIEINLSQTFQSSVQQMAEELNGMHHEVAGLLQLESEERSNSIQELSEKYAEDISKTTMKCDSMEVEFKENLASALKGLEGSLLAQQTEVTNGMMQQINVLIEGLKSEIEAGSCDLEAKLDDIRNAAVTERRSLVKTMDEERAAVRKAHEEHMRCLSTEHEARVRESMELRADLTKGLAGGRKVHQESHSQLQTMMSLESEKRQECLDAERAARANDLENISKKLRQFIDTHNTERGARDQQLKEFMQSFKAESAVTFDEKIQHHVDAHKELVQAHNQLLSAHNSLANLESSRSELAADLKRMGDGHRDEIEDLKQQILILQTMGVSDREGSESKFMSKFIKVGLGFDGGHEAFNQAIEERFSAWEAGLNGIEPRVQANTLSLQSLTNELSALDKRLLEALNMLNSYKRESEQSMDTLQGGFKQQYQTITGEQLRLSENIAQVEARCDRRCDLQKDECVKGIQEARGQLDLAITARCEALTTSSSQINKFVQGIKKEYDQALHELQLRIDQLYTTLVEERNNHVRCMDEERNAFRKVHDEHMHIVEKERDARIRQIQELRMDFTKSLRDREIQEGMSSGESFLARPTVTRFRSGTSVAGIMSNVGSGADSAVSSTSPAGSATCPPTATCPAGSGAIFADSSSTPRSATRKLSSIISNLRGQKVRHTKTTSSSEVHTKTTDSSEVQHFGLGETACCHIEM